MLKGSCSVDDCDARAITRGWCEPHYRRWLKYGDPLVSLRAPSAPVGTSVEQRLRHHGWTEVEGPLDTPCWEWNGSRFYFGCGQLKVSGRNRQVHRLAYEVWVGPIPEGAGYHGTVVRHKCDNPPCINPEHLELGTAAQNSQDMVERGRAAKGESNGNSKLTEAQVIEIRDSQKSGLVLARRFGVSASSVYRVRNGETWKEETTKGL